MMDRPAENSLVFGEDLGLLRLALPPLGLLMAVAGIGGWFIGQMRPLAAVVITALGLAAMIWSLRMTTAYTPSVVKRGGRARATRLARALNRRGSQGEGP